MTGSEDDFDAQLARVAALGEPIRRALYRYVVAQGEPVSRDEAASGVGIARHVAKFHLDKLESDGLLAAEYRRPAGRSGPGAGRPAKLYRRAERDITITLPGRRYDLAAHLMARAISSATADGNAVRDSLSQAAHGAGRVIGKGVCEALGGHEDSGAAVDAITDALSAAGYEPHRDGDTIALTNCPFHELSRDYTALVCPMNLDLIEGLVDAVDPHALRPMLVPTPDQCCVTLTRGEARPGATSPPPARA